MASRPIVPQQPKGNFPADKQQKKMAVINEGRNRRALKEIGNVFGNKAEGKAVHQRPLTRSFCAQLLANAQAAADEANIEAVAVPRKLPAEVEKKSKEVIEISPDTEKNQETTKEKGTSSTKKQTITHSAVLTARSRTVIDIDASDAGNELAAVEYVEDMYKYYKDTEDDFKLSKYMTRQPDVTPKMRSILIDWLVDVHNKFDLSPETLYLTVNIVDRYMAKETVARREVQLLGISATLTASKYEEIWAPEVNDLVMISDRTYSHGEILKMEKKILRTLGWCLTVPTPYVFLVRFSKASMGGSASVTVPTERMVFFLAELGLMSYEMMAGFSPSMFAAAAVYVARSTMGEEPRWTATLRTHTGYEENEVRVCGEMMAKIHQKALDDVKLRAVVRKYSKYHGVVCRPAAKPDDL